MSSPSEAQLPFVVGLPDGTVVCVPAWLLGLVVLALGGAEALRRLREG